MGVHKRYRTSKQVEVPHAKASSLLDCPNCHHFIGAHDVHMEKGTAKCSNCNHLFTWQEFVDRDPIGATDFAELPNGVDVLRLRSLLEIRVNHYQARSTSVVGSLFFALLWNIFLLPFLFFIISSGQWYILFFISLHLMAGIGMLRGVFSQIFDRSVVEINGGGISYTTSSLIGLAKKDQFVPKSEISHYSIGKMKRSFNTTGGQALYLHKRDGKKVKLIAGIDRKSLQYIKKSLEEFKEVE